MTEPDDLKALAEELEALANEKQAQIQPKVDSLKRVMTLTKGMSRTTVLGLIGCALCLVNLLTMLMPPSLRWIQAATLPLLSLLFVALVNRHAAITEADPDYERWLEETGRSPARRDKQLLPFWTNWVEGLSPRLTAILRNHEAWIRDNRDKILARDGKAKKLLAGVYVQLMAGFIALVVLVTEILRVFPFLAPKGAEPAEGKAAAPKTESVLTADHDSTSDERDC